MKYLKTFENIKVPQLGDYVICKDDSGTDNLDLIEFINNNIGQFVEYRTPENMDDDYTSVTEKYNMFIQYTNCPDYLSDEFNYCNTIEDCRIFSLSEIIFSSPNIEEAKDFLLYKKYNI